MPQYELQINELTDLVRHDSEWEDLRSILTASDFDPDVILLVSFMEDEEEREYGIFVKKDTKKIYAYERSTARGENDIHHFTVEDVTGDLNTKRKHPEIQVALDMINNKTAP